MEGHDASLQENTIAAEGPSMVCLEHGAPLIAAWGT